MIMRKIFGLTILIMTLSLAAIAQHCQAFDSTVIVPGTYTTPGFMPAADNQACAIAGASVSDTIYFTNFTTISGFAVDSLIIDSIGNLPNGLCWVTNKVTNTFGAGENGVIYVSGQCFAEPGQYKLQIFIEATGTIAIPPYSNAETGLGLRYYLRVACPGSSCMPIDSSGGVDSLFIPYSSQLPCAADGIKEVGNSISAFDAAPNPFSTSTVVTFYAENPDLNTLRLTDMLGNVIWSKDITVSQGSNTVTVERGQVTNGIYLLSLSGASGFASKKLVIE